MQNLAPLSAIVAAASGYLPNRFEDCATRTQRRAWVSAYRSRRPKQFGTSYGKPLSREERNAIFFGAVSVLRSSGLATQAIYNVLRVMLYDFLNLKTGECFPSHARIAQKCDCSRDTVIEALKILADLKIVDWSHRSRRACINGFLRPQRTSNVYRFFAWFAAKVKAAYKSEIPTGTNFETLSLSGLDPEVAAALLSLGRTLSEKEPPPA